MIYLYNKKICYIILSKHYSISKLDKTRPKPKNQKSYMLCPLSKKKPITEH